MNSDKERQDKVGASRPTSTFTRMERVPPLLMLLYLGIVGIGVLFLILLGAYIHSRLQSGMPTGLYSFPRFFSLSTIVLLSSSYTLAQAARLYQADDMRNLARCLGATFALGLIFAGLQIMGWRELMDQGIYFRGDASGTYVYLISALHVAHLLAGMLFMSGLFLRVLHISRDGVRTLLFIRNPYRRMQLRMLSLYWHFMGGLWVLMFTIFLFFY
ncbi:cytochrome c oxidase subunit III [Hymenobacter sp. BT730]|uniref:cytochrome c oxidase subunit 3 n=1 Tax=Hymenobacter sp. BT730 TaxID=3063332 RepID=UPI0026E060EF|nr:cytochrome c oxidase subunit III [Hymenobacter sp. BT730]